MHNIRSNHRYNRQRLTSLLGERSLYALIAVLTGGGLCCIYSCFYRTKFRAQYGLRESSCPDFFAHCCCELCALCQADRELKNRGFDMSLGWHANKERRGFAVSQPPAYKKA